MADARGVGDEWARRYTYYQDGPEFRPAPVTATFCWAMRLRYPAMCASSRTSTRDVSSANLIGSNREYIEKEIPHIWTLVDQSMDRVVERSDVVVIGNGTPAFRDVERHLGNGKVVVDLVRAFGDRLSDGKQYHGINW